MALTDASLSASNVVVAMLFFADFDGYPIRVAFAPCPLTVSGGLTDADSDCAGFTFDTVSPDILRIGSVTHADGGTDTLTVTLAADPTTPDLLSAIEDPAQYAGRAFRIWLALHDNAGTVTQLRPLYRGYMMQPSQEFDGSEFTITMMVENWRAIIAAAPGRSYLAQSTYDAGDLSANVSLGQGNSAPAIVGADYARPGEDYR